MRTDKRKWKAIEPIAPNYVTAMSVFFNYTFYTLLKAWFTAATPI